MKPFIVVRFFPFDILFGKVTRAARDHVFDRNNYKQNADHAMNDTLAR